MTFSEIARKHSAFGPIDALKDGKTNSIQFYVLQDPCYSLSTYGSECCASLKLCHALMTRRTVNLEKSETVPAEVLN